MCGRAERYRWVGVLRDECGVCFVEVIGCARRLAFTRCSDGLPFVCGVLACGRGAALLMLAILLAPCGIRRGQKEAPETMGLLTALPSEVNAGLLQAVFAS